MTIYNLFPRLQTERLTLRDLRPADRSAVFRIYQDEIISRFSPWRTATTIHDAERIINEIRAVYQNRRGIYWGVALQQKGQHCWHLWFH